MFYPFQSIWARDPFKWRVSVVLVFQFAILKFWAERTVSVKPQLHLVKTKVWVIWTCENPTTVSNKVLASIVFPFWPRHPVRIENFLVKSRLRCTQWHIIEFESFGTVLPPNPCKNVQNPSHDIGSIVEMDVSTKAV